MKNILSSQKSSAKQGRHVMIEPYCVLCRKSLMLGWERKMTERRYPKNKAPPKDLAFGFLRVSDSQHWLEKPMFPIELPIIDDYKYPMVYRHTKEELLKAGIKLCLCQYNCTHCDLDKTANFVHLPCYRFARAMVPQINYQVLIDITSILCPISSWRYTLPFMNPPRDMPPLPSAEVKFSTEFGRLVWTVRRRLPPEIQNEIARHLSPELWLSLVNCLSTVAWALESNVLNKPTPVTGDTVVPETTFSRTTVKPEYTSPNPNGSLAAKGLAWASSLITRNPSDTEAMLPNRASYIPSQGPPLPFFGGNKSKNEDKFTQISFPFSNSDQVNNIRASFAYILGTSYLSRIGPADDDTYEQEIEVLTLEISSIDLSFQQFGVTALRLRYLDGSTSSWLGSPSADTCTTRHGRSLKALRVESDGYKIVSMAFERSDQRTRILWNLDSSTAMNLRCKMIDAGDRGGSMRRNPETRFGKYLSFDNISSLTAWCTPRGVSSIQVNDNADTRLGTPDDKSCPVTFYLEESERIRCVYLILTGTALYCHYGPFLLAVTTSGRQLFYGPPCRLTEETCRFLRFRGEDEHTVAGIFTDPTNSFHGIKTWGVALKPSEQRYEPCPSSLSVETVPFLEIAPQMKNHGTDWFLSKAVFAGAQELETQWSYGCATGILAHFKDGTTQVLGRWDPSSTNNISRIYRQAKNRPLYSISFRHVSLGGRFSGQKVVKTITVNDDGSPIGDEVADSDIFTWEDLSKECAWWYCTDANYVEEWGNSTVASISEDKRAQVLFVY